MPTDRQRLIEKVFLEATELPAPNRGAFLIERCGDDAALRQEVESLLGMHDGGAGLLDEPQPMTQGLMRELSGLLRTDDAALPPSGKIGAYTVHRVLGSGGMGVVYLAEQERPKRTVALKVIRRGLATPSLLRRFEHEAEILGRLQHPGIAQIYEAGVADDGFGPQPYIAMEFIDGRPLTEHAKVRRLGVREKIELMVRVCEGVQHAHQRGVIHRDLKPGNILVQDEPPSDTTTIDAPKTSSGVGQPKILDFGVARIAEGPGGGAGAGGGGSLTTMGTNIGQLIGTLAYMSPEQLGSDTREVDTRSDVHALGVVLYQLLTGKLPYDVTSRALPEAVRLIKEDTPDRLGSVVREYRGDLETIVAKAIEKDKARRYQSAAELGADLQRYLAGEPIAAKRDSALYMFRKQLKRYRSVVSAALIAVVALVSFTVYAAISAERARALANAESVASSIAQAQSRRADAAASRLKEELAAAMVERGRLEGLSGKVALAEEFLWREHFLDPDSPHPLWALRELYDRNPCRWTVQTPEQLRTMVTSPDGELIALGGDDRRISVYDGATGTLLHRSTTLPSPLQSLAFDPAARRLAFGLANGQAGLVDADMSGPPTYLGAHGKTHASAVRSVLWTPAGDQVITGGGDRLIRLWDAASRAAVRTLGPQRNAVSAMAVSADGQFLASGDVVPGPDARIGLWSLADGRKVRDLGCGGETVFALAFSPDGARLAIGFSERHAAILDLNADEPRFVPMRFGWACRAVAFTPDGNELITAASGEVRLWRVQDLGQVLDLGQHREGIVGAGWLSGRRFASASIDGVLKCWDVRPTVARSGFSGFDSWCFGTAYSPDGSSLAVSSGDGTVAVFDPATGQRRATFGIGPSYRTRPVRFLPDGQQLLTGSVDGVVRVLDIPTVTEVARLGNSGIEVISLALHPDGRTIAVAHADSIIRIWDLKTLAMIRELRGFPTRTEGVAFSPDGSILACSGYTKGIGLWDTTTWTEAARLPAASKAWPVAFSPDGSIIAAGTWGDSVELWDARSHAHLASLTGHQGLISTIAFSPDGQYLASGGDDATVRLWHVKSRRTLFSFDTNHGEATGLSFDPTGSRLTTACEYRFVANWDLSSIDPYIAGNADYQRARLKAELPPPLPAE